MARQQKDYTYDHALRLKDAGAITSSAAAQVGGADRVLDLGTGRWDGTVVADISAITTADASQVYTLEWQVSNSATFASGNVVGAALRVGHATATGSSANTAAATRMELGVTNEVNGVVFRYARMFTRVAGTGSPSVNYVANAHKED
jgi:hypothetical protein